MPAECCYKRAIIPKRSFFAAIETRPQIIAFFPQIAKDCSCVMQFIGGGDESSRCGRFVEMCDVFFFSFTPRWLWNLVSIRATGDDFCHGFSKSSLDIS